MAKQIDRGMENRQIALDIVTEVLEEGHFIHLVLRQALDKYAYLDKADRAFITRLSEGVIERRIQIDAILNQYSKVKTQKMKPVIRNLLRLGVYQILFMDRVPDSAACNEAVKLAKRRRMNGLEGFVNGVLRAISRQKEAITYPNDWTRLSLPQWLYEMWEVRYGKSVTEKMGEALLNEEAGLCGRLNFSAIAREYPERDEKGLKELAFLRLAAEGVHVTPSELLPECFWMSGHDRLEDLTAFRKGWFLIQDFSSALVAQAAAPREGEQVIDVCAAPGGKSLHIADRMRGTGNVIARDLTETKVGMIEENVARCGLLNVTPQVWDALVLDEKRVGQADLVIADLPCSGLGIIGKKPDIKEHMNPQALLELAALQREILSVAWQYVKPGGRLVFSTCTVDAKENEENVAWIKKNLPFEAMDLRPMLGEWFSDESLKDGYLQLLPGVHPTDGFFISVFERKRN